MLKDIFNWLFPIYCAGCGDEDWALCPDCEKLLHLSGDNGFFATVERNVWGEAVDGLASLFVYQKKGPLAEMLHLYKYGLMEDYGRKLSQLWRNNFSFPLLAEVESQIDLVSWIPLYKRKLKSRGFNQSEMLALDLPSSKLRVPLLIRRRDTPAQMTLPREQRLSNMQDAFAVCEPFKNPEGDLGGKRILLVDDVVTTGATLAAAAAALKGAGAAKVFALVLARQKE